jgi:hypothetical protein
MVTVQEVRGHGRPRTPGTTTDDRPLTLSEEHGLLLRQVAARVDDLLAVTAEDRWPTRELQALLVYMRAEVLRQAVDEERLLFPAHHAPPDSLPLSSRRPPGTSLRISSAI